MAYKHACQLVAQKAGDSYQTKPNRFATNFAPEQLHQDIDATLIERSGIWFIYQTDQVQFARLHCAPRKVHDMTMLPVVLNKASGSNAVVNGVFMLQTHRWEDINLIAQQYSFKKITQLPNRFTAIFDVKPQESYDEMIIKLDNDKNIARIVPLLSEKRHHSR